MVATKSNPTGKKKQANQEDDSFIDKAEFARGITEFAAATIPGGSLFKAGLEKTKHGNLVEGFVGDVFEVVEKNWIAFGLRELAFFGSAYLKDAVKNNISLDSSDPNAKNIRLLVDWGTDATIVLIEPFMLALNAKAENDKLREEIRAELEGFPETIRPSIIVPEFQHKNPVLAKLEEKLTAQFQEAYPEILTSLAIGGAQLYAHKKYNENKQKKVDKEAKRLETEIKTTSLEDIERLETKHDSNLNKKNDDFNEIQRISANQLKDAKDDFDAKIENLSKELNSLAEKYKQSTIKDFETKSEEILKKQKEATKKYERWLEETTIKNEAAKTKHANLINEITTAFEENKDNLSKKSASELEKLKEKQAELKQTHSAVISLTNRPFGAEGEHFDKLTPYKNGAVNITTASIASAAFLGKNSANFFKGDVELKNRVVAAEMIIYLSQQFREGEISKDGIVHLDGLKAKYDVPEEWGREMKLDNFIGAIFNTHVYDQSGQIIPQRFHAKLQSASHAIADAILEGNNDLTTESKLNPLALIELVGSGKIVAHDGLHVANNEVATQEVEKAIKLMPLSTEIDSYKYIEKLGKSLGVTPDEAIDNIKDKLRGMDSETRDFVALLIPKDVLVNEFELPANAIDDSRHRAGEFALDNVKEVLYELGEKSDKELIDDGLNKVQVKLIKENYRHVLEDNDEALLASLRNREENGVGFAILCAKSYMQELANGKKIIGYSSDNNVMNFEPKEIEHNQEVTNVIDPENADIASTSQRAQKGENMVAAS
jgi:hypothetical protein